jgi:hypothetical protein
MEYPITKAPKSVRWYCGNWSGSLSQNMIIKPKTTKQTKVTAPKINKNRLLGDFCLLLKLNGITY